jgi:hypothetical protein
MVTIFPFATDNSFEPLKGISGSIPHRLCHGTNGFDSVLELIFHRLCPRANRPGSALEDFDAAGSLKRNDRN